MRNRCLRKSARRVVDHVRESAGAGLCRIAIAGRVCLPAARRGLICAPGKSSGTPAACDGQKCACRLGPRASGPCHQADPGPRRRSPSRVLSNNNTAFLLSTAGKRIYLP